MDHVKIVSSVESVIAGRRTIKPHQFSGEVVADEYIRRMLEAANWAPTHGHTQPWHFVVYAGEGKNALLRQLQKMDEDDNGFNEIRRDKLRESIESSSHILGIGMRRGENPKIPELEEMLAVATAVQNMWLTASSLGIGAYWSTGARGYDPRLAKFMGLDPRKDKALGLFFVGDFKGKWPQGKRLLAIEEKSHWVRT